MNTTELLKKARELITDPAHWTQRRYGETEDGKILCAASMVEAYKVCAVGALYKAISNKLDHYETVLEAKNELTKGIDSHEEEKYKNLQITDFNDQTSHEEVLALFDTTIERLEEE